MLDETVTPETLHRTAKYFMDDGRADGPEHAVRLLRGFGVYIEVGPEVAASRDHQIALLTLVNLARRTFLGGVHVIGAPAARCLVPLTDAATIEQAVTRLGGRHVARRSKDWPSVLIGRGEPARTGAPCWRLTWDGWRGGAVPAAEGRTLPERDSGGLAAAFAAAACAAEVFLFHAGDHPMAGRRPSGASLWRPEVDWLAADASEPPITLLPSKLWLVGLGNLGQAALWGLACLPWADPGVATLILQDDDRVAPSNESTSLLTSRRMVGRMKTRAVAEWLEARGFRPTVEERRFGPWMRRAPHEPAVALCGVDNALARASLEAAGFGLVVEAGLGAGPHAFRNFSLHTFPSSYSAAQLWASASPAPPDVLQMPAYAASLHPGLDACGITQLASRSVGVPFVGLAAASFMLAEVLRRLHGGPAYELVSASIMALDHVEVSQVESVIYEFGHVPAETLTAIVDVQNLRVRVGAPDGTLVGPI